MWEPENSGCMGFTEVKDGRCGPASESNRESVTPQEEKEWALRVALNCLDKTAYVEAEQSTSPDSESVNSTTERAECRKPGVKSRAVKQNLLATRRVTLASEAKTLTATNGNTARWENRRKRSRCSSTRKKLKVEIFRLHMQFSFSSSSKGGTQGKQKGWQRREGEENFFLLPHPPKGTRLVSVPKHTILVSPLCNTSH